MRYGAITVRCACVCFASVDGRWAWGRCSSIGSTSRERQRASSRLSIHLSTHRHHLPDSILLVGSLPVDDVPPRAGQRTGQANDRSDHGAGRETRRGRVPAQKPTDRQRQA